MEDTFGQPHQATRDDQHQPDENTSHAAFRKQHRRRDNLISEFDRKGKLERLSVGRER